MFRVTRARRRLGNHHLSGIDQRRIVRVGFRTIDPLRYGPTLQVIVRRRFKHFRPHLSAQPWRELVFGQQHWHAVVDVGHERVGLGDDHGAGLQLLAARAVFPFVPQPSSGQQRRTVGRREIPGLLPAGRPLPFVIARHRDKAACTPEGVAEDRLRLDRLRTGVKRRDPQFLERLAPPPRHKPPAHRDEFAPAVLRGHDVDGIRRAHVAARPQIVRRRLDGQPIERDEFSPGRLNRETSAHDERLPAALRLRV
jgi:hypothetical protein